MIFLLLLLRGLLLLLRTVLVTSLAPALAVAPALALVLSGDTTSTVEGPQR